MFFLPALEQTIQRTDCSATIGMCELCEGLIVVVVVVVVAAVRVVVVVSVV